ncbi:stalk domain-containing protein [Paenibacillus allorhizosphaerae]|uniref:Virginiamycin B lyase n=1 Tax=Paenibacillus allorhizosphaerae TaxID=2849866 RepID=A0ABN7TPP9_9BACL|nr:stalk domain-containing protein [Paenibacillus allorhizosphaerae]CAG7645283.1 Virginiamycin B lyase [Paenibacillus allorhizosphaerae]
MNHKKRLAAISIMTGSLLFSAAAGAAAESVKSDMAVLIGDTETSFAKQSLLVDSSLYAPYEAAAKQLGAEAKWSAGMKTLTLVKDGNTLEMKAGALSYKMNGLELTSATPLQEIGGSVYIPVRTVFEAFGYQIGYENKTRTVSMQPRISTKPALLVHGITPDGYVTGSEVKVSISAYNHILKDFAQQKEPKAGEGHIHVWLDNEKLDAASAIKVFKNEPVVFRDVKPGKHTLTVQLVGNDHKPVEPEVKQTIPFHSVSLSILKDLDPEKSTGLRIEGVIADEKHRVFTVEMESKKLYRIMADSGKMDILTELPRSATGMAFDAAGNLYIASGGQEGVIFKVNAKDLNGEPFETSRVETFVSGVQGANGLTFDSKGNLYVSGGANGNIYKVTPDGQLSTYQSGIAAERKEQQIVVNGIAFGKDGKLYAANTSSGEVNRFTMNADGSLGAWERVAKSPLLYGADGLNFGPDGAIYVAANERNAIVRVSLDGKVTEVAQNGNQGPLEFPASLHFVGSTLYISNFDQPRGANSPNDPGIGASIAKMEFGSTK